jgi:hypothetical protein
VSFANFSNLHPSLDPLASLILVTSHGHGNPRYGVEQHDHLLDPRALMGDPIKYPLILHAYQVTYLNPMQINHLHILNS